MNPLSAGKAVGRHDIAGGFSLLEMLLVLLILGLVSSLFVPAFRPTAEVGPSKMADQLRTAFLQARTNAISRGSTETVHIDLSAKQVTYARETVVIPANIETAMRVGRELVVADGTAAVLFLPDGGSTGAELVFTDDHGNASGLVVSWLTGLPTALRELPE